VEQITSEWIPKLTGHECRREAAAMEILGIRTELERRKVDESARAVQGTLAQAAPHELLQRLSAIEGYLRRENLRGILVDFGRASLHLALAGVHEVSVDLVLQELIEHLRFMGATARLSEIAEEFAGTPISERPLFKQLFAPARLDPSAHGKPGRATAPIPQAEIALDSTDSRTRIFAFGPLRVIPAGGSEPLTRSQWASRRARVLLAYLLAKDLEGRGVTREQIWEAVWRDSESFDPANAFHITMTRLRSALRRGHDGCEAGSIRFADGWYRLEGDSIWCDAREFEREMRQAEKLARDGHRDESLRARQAAFDLYEGEFLADTDEIWAEARRERFRARFLESGRELVEAAMGEGRIRDAERIAEKVVVCDQGEEGPRLLDLIHSETSSR
jgi:DNA-binding SARP family transcriptional activator